MNPREWLFRALMFEAEAEEFQRAGIRVGASSAKIEQALLEQSLSQFDIDTRKEALQMARIYSLLYCFENSVRELIKQRLEEVHGVDWWEKGIPIKTREFAQGRLEEAQRQSWLEGQKTDLLSFVDFGHLAKIITEQWSNFSDLIPSQQWLTQRMDELEKARHFIAHNRLLLPSEFQRIEMYVSDWNRVVGI